MTLLAETPADEVDENELVVGRRIQEFSQLAGPVRELDDDGRDYRVSYRGVDAVHGRGRVWRSLAIASLNFVFEALFFTWLLHPAHRPPVTGPPIAQYANWVVIGSIALMELLRLINVLSLSLASVISRDPVPVSPQPNQRIAFLTTIVPSKEPIDVVRGTLQAALRIRYQGILDVWLLDEGDDPAVRAMCRELGVNHFTRKGVEEYNRKKGPFKAKTKHGNYNAWVAEHGDSYEIFLSVDPDHVPLPNYAERILGYFRDPDVSFVVGPQCYANDETFVTRAAESQQFPFHSLIQRAANRYNAAMLVGTNNAIRISALKGIGGLSDSVTEDMATGLKFHARRNPQTKARWKSVYTPDVLAVGEGPSSWGDFFSQQMRWSRGTFEVLLTEFWRRLPALSPGRALHYCLITTFYPSMAIGWILGAVNAVLFLALGVQGVVVPVQLWLALYIDATAFQLWVYLRNRRYNVSPYEAEGSSGVKGMLMSIFASPIFSASLIATVLRLPAKFVVTPKGLSSSADHILTFRRHLQWGLLLVGAIVTSIVMGYATPAVLLWPAVALLACLTPPALWIIERVVGRQPVITAEPRTSGGRTGITTESLQRAALDAMIAEGPASAPFRSPLADGQAAGGPVAGGLPEGWIRTGTGPATVGASGQDARSAGDAPGRPGRADAPSPGPREAGSGERYRSLPPGWVRDDDASPESEARRPGGPSPAPRTNGLHPRPLPPAAERRAYPGGAAGTTGGPGNNGRSGPPSPGPGQPAAGQSGPGRPGPGQSDAAQPGVGQPRPGQPGGRPVTAGPSPSKRPSPAPRPGTPPRPQPAAPPAAQAGAVERSGVDAGRPPSVDQPGEPGRHADTTRAPSTDTPGEPGRHADAARPPAAPGAARPGDGPRPSPPGRPDPAGRPADPARGPDSVRPSPRPAPRPRPDAASPPGVVAVPENRPERAAPAAAVHRNELSPTERRSGSTAAGRPEEGSWSAPGHDGAPPEGAAPVAGAAAPGPPSPTPPGPPSPTPLARPRPTPGPPPSPSAVVEPARPIDAAPASEDAHEEHDGLSTAERSLHASTVAVRVVALAAVAPAVAAAHGDGGHRSREPEQTEAS